MFLTLAAPIPETTVLPQAEARAKARRPGRPLRASRACAKARAPPDLITAFGGLQAAGKAKSKGRCVTVRSDEILDPAARRGRAGSRILADPTTEGRQFSSPGNWVLKIVLDLENTRPSSRCSPCRHRARAGHRGGGFRSFTALPDGLRAPLAGNQ